jgi:hypothetical protein
MFREINIAMKNLFLFLALELLFHFAFTQQNRSFQFIESSTGMHYPSWESGMTELEFADINMDGFVDILSIGDHGCPNINAQEHGIMAWFGDGTGIKWTPWDDGLATNGEDWGLFGTDFADVDNDVDLAGVSGYGHLIPQHLNGLIFQARFLWQATTRSFSSVISIVTGSPTLLLLVMPNLQFGKTHCSASKTSSGRRNSTLSPPTMGIAMLSGQEVM